MLRDSAVRQIADSVIGKEPRFYIMNQLRTTSRVDDTIFLHKLVEYSGWLHTAPAFRGTTFVRICIVQPRMGGQEYATDVPRVREVFGTEEPTIATPINEVDFVRVSDRHYLVSSQRRFRLDYSHRLSHNSSHQQPTMGAVNNVWMGPMYLCIFGEELGSAHHFNIVTRTIGFVSRIPSTRDMDFEWDD